MYVVVFGQVYFGFTLQIELPMQFTIEKYLGYETYAIITIEHLHSQFFLRQTESTIDRA